MSNLQAKPEEFDLVVIGSGEGGKYLAWALGAEGQRVALVERKYIGGSCPNIACLPSKNVIHSAKVVSYFQRAEEFGIRTEGWKVSMAGVTERKRKMVRELVDIHLDNFQKNGVELVHGTGRFVAPKTIEVALNEGGTRLLTGRNVVINTGSRAAVDATPGLRDARPITHIEALELERLPAHLLVLGGGYIALEMAQAMRRLGSRVTIIERNERLLHREDEDISQALLELCEEEEIEVVTGARLENVEGLSGSGVRLQVRRGSSEVTIEGTDLLVASGRTPNTQDLGVDSAGVCLTERGFIQVNERLQTSADGVWAIGDCTGGPHFTHVSYDDFRVVRENLAGRERVTTGRQVPFCLFTDPEFARIGLSEKQATAMGVRYRLARLPMASVLRTRTLSETGGFLKALIDTESDRILGFTAFGVAAGEIMGAVQIAMLAGMPFTALRDSVLTHPTLLEGLTVLFARVPARAG